MPVAVARKLFLTKGIGRHEDRLVSLALAVRNARIAQFNLVHVSGGILPPRCELITAQEGLRRLSPGQIVHALVSTAATNEPHRVVAASTAVAMPKDRSRPGCVATRDSAGEAEQQAAQRTEELAVAQLAALTGIELDRRAAYDAHQDLWTLAGDVIITRSVTQSVAGDRGGTWTSVLAAALFLP
jgi:arginine decarboxylase